MRVPAVTIVRLTLVVAAAAAINLIAAPFQDEVAARGTRFQAWQRAHPDVPAAIADLNAKTAALIAAAGAPTPGIGAPPVVHRVAGALADLWDDPVAPELVIVPAGSFTMGSPMGEPGRVVNEGPQYRVTLAVPIAIGKYAVTRDEYAAFVTATGRPDAAFCSVSGHVGFSLGTGISQRAGATWRNPGFPQTGSDPVVCVSWNDAQAYVTWLTEKTGRTYRLLSEAEWEYAARAGTTTAYPWGDRAERGAANYGKEPTDGIIDGAADGPDRWMYTAPVGSFPPNAFGLFDMVGNVSEWVQDCFGTYAPPATGVARECAARVARGANWSSRATFARSAYRNLAPGTAHRSSAAGFRVARVL